MEKEKTKLYQKWWFWVCIVLIILIIALTIFMTTTIKEVKERGINGAAYQIQQQYNNATLYTSVGNNSLILELKNFDTEQHAIMYENIISIIKNNIDTELKNYSELIVLTYFDKENKESYMSSKTTYSLPDFLKKEDINYIDFLEYKELYNNYSETMKSYTQLFNSIGR